MDETSRIVAIVIQAAPERVYAFASDPRNLPRWAPGFCRRIEFVSGRWQADTPLGRVVIEFAPANAFGVLDHTVTLPDGTRVLNPMRVLPLGNHAEVQFVLRRQPGMSDAQLEKDARLVLEDLRALRDAIEGSA